MGIALEILVKPEIMRLFDEQYDGILFDSEKIDDAALIEFKHIMERFGSLPTNVSKICDALGDVKSDIKEVAELFEGDPGLAGRLLKLVNSSYYGFSGKISDLRRALSLLGFDTIRSLILGEGVFIGMRRIGLPSDVSIKDLWIHSVAVGRVAERVGIRVSGVDKSLLMSAGLLHDAGKLLMAGMNSEGFIAAVDKAREGGADLLKNEIEITGFSHPLLSGALCANWNLPTEMRDAILFQQHPVFSSNKSASAVLMLSDFHVRRAEMGADGQPASESPPAAACEILKITAEQAMAVVLEDELEEIRGNIASLTELD